MLMMMTFYSYSHSLYVLLGFYASRIGRRNRPASRLRRIYPGRRRPTSRPDDRRRRRSVARRCRLRKRRPASPFYEEEKAKKCRGFRAHTSKQEGVEKLYLLQ